MSRNSIGQFIAALRKANGMTQQELADRLNVSNKAVSRWERDECAPDISLIPPLAEIFDVTCDELLKGERITDASPQEKKEPKVQKQVKSLINRTLSGFKTLICISLAISAIALICMFGISYGFFRPIIGFAVMLLFEVAALVLAVLAVNKAKSVKADNEVFEEADDSLIAKFNNTLGSFSFAAFFAIISVVLLSLPLVLTTSKYVDSVLTAQSYFSYYFGGIVLIMALILITCRKPYIERITDTRSPKNLIAPKVRIMSAIQIGLIIIVGLIAMVSSYFDAISEAEPFLIIIQIAGCVCLAAIIACFVVFLLKNKEERNEFILPGIRNIILIYTLRILSHAHYSWRSYENNKIKWGDYWQIEYVWYAVIFVMLVFVVFYLIDMLIKRTRKND